MSRIQAAFQGRKAFIAFITCGDPDLETDESSGEGGSGQWRGSDRAGDPFF